MKGKTVVITGGISGIGEIAAERLAQMGARIVLIARSKSRRKVTLARLHEKAPDLAHTVHYADLTRISEMKRVAAEIASQEPRIDVLINNAGQCSPTADSPKMASNARAESHGVFCYHRGAARKAPGLRAGAHRQHSFRRASGSQTRFRRSATFYLRANSPAACMARRSPPIACIPASSPRASAMKAAA
jgi:NAD(P)-dependent dehydrogenase (short-subunit alcohol dehydrogenase family)